MTIHFDIMPVDERTQGSYRPTRLKLALSNANAVRMLGILGIEAPAVDVGVLPRDAIADLLKRVDQARADRLKSVERSARYELPRLEQFHVLFETALKKRCGVVIARTSDD